MDDSEQSCQEDDDSGLEIINLEPSELSHAIDTLKYRLSSRVAQKPPSPRFPLRRRKTQIAVTSVVTIVGLVIFLSVSGVFSALLASVARSSHPSSATTVRIHVISISHVGEEDGLSCLMDTAWSPNSQQVAVLGYATNCPDPQKPDVAGLINLYSARTATVVAHLHPDVVIQTALKEYVTQPLSDFIINYASILWSPDGQQLAVAFDINSYNNYSASFNGLLIVGPEGKQHVFLHQFYGTLLVPSYMVWDVQQGTVTEVPLANPPFQSSYLEDYYNIDAALMYHWGANGQLVPDINASSTSAFDAIGNPDGASSFSIWQPGLVEWTAQVGNGTVHLPGVYLWQTFFSAWSPDGRYLADGLATGSLLHIPGQRLISHQALKDLGLDQLATIQVHNTAVIRLLRSLSSSSSTGSPSGSGANVAWRPDGRVVAVDNAGIVVVYDCATGRELASLLPHSLYPLNLDGGNGDSLSWSPDGSHLLLASTTWGLSIWGPGQLPK
jgi:WD40 repeat protein